MQLHGQGLSPANPPSMVKVFVLLLLLLLMPGDGTVAFDVEFKLLPNSSLPEESKSLPLDRYGTLHFPVKEALPTPCHASAIQRHPLASSHSLLGPEQYCPQLGLLSASLGSAYPSCGGPTVEEAAPSSLSDPSERPIVLGIMPPSAVSIPRIGWPWAIRRRTLLSKSELRA